MAAIDLSRAEELAGPPLKPAVAPPTDHVTAKEWMAVFGAMIGAFMAVLNIQITNSSLAEIQGSLGATLDEGSWISTSYLVAEIVVIPLSGWLAQVFSIRLYLLGNAFLFLVFSAACATATDLSTMVVYRAFQGFTGGVLIPMAFSITLTTLPKSKQPMGLSLFALTATFAPAIGPTIGGWVTENYGWQYIFYLGLVPGVFMVAFLWGSIAPRPMQLGLLRKGDWSGIITMAIGLSTTEVVLEEGNRKDWFGSTLIVDMTIIAVVSLAAFFTIELTRKNPVLNLRLLTDRVFGLASVVNVTMGVALYGSVYLVPVYLSQMQGYNAQQIGNVMVWVGLPQLILIPTVPWFMRRVDPRFLVAFGMALFATSCLMNARLSPDNSGPQFLLPNLVRALGQAFLVSPLSSIATSQLTREQAGSASGLFNMMRNLGGSVGIALMSTLVTKREQFHSNYITENVSLYDPATQQRIDRLTDVFMSRGVDTDLARHKAIALIAETAQRDAFILSYGDAFALIGLTLIVGLVAVAFIGKTKAQTGPSEAH
jgi:MFS transporter, DHA2 family, multidrug resistance protein